MKLRRKGCEQGSGRRRGRRERDRIGRGGEIDLDQFVEEGAIAISQAKNYARTSMMWSQRKSWSRYESGYSCRIHA